MKLQKTNEITNFHDNILSLDSHIFYNVNTYYFIKYCFTL